jgi:hypothetical protein
VNDTCWPGPDGVHTQEGAGDLARGKGSMKLPQEADAPGGGGWGMPQLHATQAGPSKVSASTVKDIVTE